MQAAPCRSDALVAISLVDHPQSPRGRGSHKMQEAPCRSDAPVAIKPCRPPTIAPRARLPQNKLRRAASTMCAAQKKTLHGLQGFQVWATQGHIKPRALEASERPVHQPRVIFSTRVPPRLAGPSPAAWGLKLLAPNCLGPRANLSPAPAAPRGAGRAAFRLSPPRSSQRPP